MTAAERATPLDLGQAASARPTTGHLGRIRWVRVAALAWTGIALLAAATLWWAVYTVTAADGLVGWDAKLYVELIPAHWFQTGELYYQQQLAGPYIPEGVNNLYPPLAMYLFVPMSFLPRVLWWVIPLAVIGWHIARCRPALWSWPVMATCLAVIPSAAIVVYGNTDLWSAAILALACRWPVMSWLLAFKPSVLPLAAGFVREGRWWMGGVVILALSLPFGGQWLDYITALQNIEGGSLLRSATALPWLAVPVIAWLARKREPESV